MDKNVHPIIAKKVKEKYLDEVTERKKKGESVYDLSLSGKITSALWNLVSPSDEAEAKQKIHKGYDDEDAVQAARDARSDKVWEQQAAGQGTVNIGVFLFKLIIVFGSLLLLLFLVYHWLMSLEGLEFLGGILLVICGVYVAYIAIKDSSN